MHNTLKDEIDETLILWLSLRITWYKEPSIDQAWYRNVVHLEIACDYPSVSEGDESTEWGGCVQNSVLMVVYCTMIASDGQTNGSMWLLAYCNISA
jgi:hypothetical protein